MSAFRTIAGMCALSVAACSPSSDDSAAGTPAASGELGVLTAVESGTTVGMSTPESVRYDGDQDVWFISNIVGNPSQKDGKAFIARVPVSNVSEMTLLVEGGVNGVTLNAPKGMAIVGDTLWVTDIDVLRGFNRRSGAPVATVEFSGFNVSFLNDVAAGPDGALYVTDTGIQFDASGNMSQTGSDRIFQVLGRNVAELAFGAALANPNGLAWDKLRSRWILGPFSGTDLLELTAGSSAPAAIATGPGSYDGVEVMDDGRILVTSWADSAVHVVTNGVMSRLAGGLNAPADIGFDAARMVLAVPQFNDNRVVYFQIR